MITGVKLAAPVLVETARGDVEGRTGDYLVITEDGRQVVMTEAEYLAATGAAESASPGIPEAEVSTAPVPKKGMIAELKIRPSTFTLINFRALENLMKTGERPIRYEPPNLKPSTEPVRKGPKFLYSIVNRKRPVEPAPAQVLEDPPAEEEVLPEPEAVVRPPPPSQEGRPLASLESLVIPKRREGSFRSFMRPGPAPVPAPAKAKKKAKRPMVLPFQKKKAKKAEEPGKERYRYVKPEWV